MITNSIAVTGAKGGSGKSTIATNLAFSASHLFRVGHWPKPVLFVNTDATTTAGMSLGALSKSDGGENLAAALLGKAPLVPVKGIRRGLDMVFSGPAVRRAYDQLSVEVSSGALRYMALEEALAPIASNYSLIVFDSPPLRGLAHTLLYTATASVLFPTKPDLGSVNELGTTMDTFLDVRRSTNPSLQLNGIVLSQLPAAATHEGRVAKEALRKIVGPDIHVYDTAIREATTPHIHMRELGLSISEYFAQTLLPPSDRLQRAGGRINWSSAAAKMMEEWEDLFTQIITRFNRQQQSVLQQIDLTSHTSNTGIHVKDSA